MASAFSWTIVALFCVACICSSVLAESGNSPFIVAHKRVSQRKLKPDLERISVSIDIYNTGSETAFDVTLTDNQWPKKLFQIVMGNMSKSWDRLDSGSQVTHTYELESRVQGVFRGVPAVITYRIPTKAKLQEAYSTPIMPVKVLLEEASESKVDIAKRLFANYGQQASVVLLVSIFALILIAPSKSGVSKKKKH